VLMGLCMAQMVVPKLECRLLGLDVQFLLFQRFTNVNSSILKTSEPPRGRILGILIIPKVTKNLCAVRLEMLSLDAKSE